jgi:anti-sigma factor RsiW
MIEARIEELIQLEIDGQNPPEASERLQAILQTDPAIRRRYEQMQQLTHDIEGVGLVAPPEGLREEIHRRIEGAKADWAPRPSRRPRRAFSAREIFAFATGLAAGIVIFAFLGRALLPGEDLDPLSISGSMVPNPHAAILPVTDRHSVHGNGVDAEVVVRSDSDFVVAEIDLRSPGQLELALEFDSSGLALVGCERPAASSGELLLGSDRLSVSDSQDGPYRFIFRKRVEDASSPLQLRLDRGAWSARESLGITPPTGGSPG